MVFILMGTTIYTLCRRNISFVVYITGIEEGILASICDGKNPIINFIVYCLPDGLWYASLLLLLKVIYSDDFFGRTIYTIGILSPFVLELLQLKTIIPGTFDILDLITYTIVLIIVEMKTVKNHLYHICQMLALVTFVIMALACGTSQEVVERGNTYNHDGTQLIESVDSISIDQYTDYIQYALSK